MSTIVSYTSIVEDLNLSTGNQRVYFHIKIHRCICVSIDCTDIICTHGSSNRSIWARPASCRTCRHKGSIIRHSFCNSHIVSLLTTKISNTQNIIQNLVRCDSCLGISLSNSQIRSTDQNRISSICGVITLFRIHTGKGRHTGYCLI